MPAAKVVGTVLQLVGLTVAGWGVAQTRAAYAPELPGVLGTLDGWRRVVLVVVWRTWGWVRRVVLRRPRRPVHVSVQGTAGSVVFSGGMGLLQLGYSPVDPTAPVADQVSQLDQRLRDTRDLANRLERDLRNLTDRTAGVETSLQEALQREAAQRRQDLRELAAGGLRREALGLWAVAAGTFIAAFG